MGRRPTAGSSRNPETLTDEQIADVVRPLAALPLWPLPATVVSTSRTDGVSGIGLFQVPPGRLWTPSVRARQRDGLVTGPIDVIQRRHRYAKTDERAATFKADRLAQHIRRVVDSTPLLTPTQRDRLAVLLQSPRTSS